MKRRLVILVVALALGGGAAVLAARYIEGARSRVQFESGTVEVLVATEDIPRGLTSEEMFERKLIVARKYPREVVTAGAVSSMRTLEGQVLAVPLSKGEQVTEARFQYPQQAGLAYSVPKDYAALSIPTDEAEAVGGLLKAQDRVMVVATFPKNASKNEGVTRVIVRDALVLAVGTKVGLEKDKAEEENQSSGGLLAGRNSKDVPPPTVTVALSPDDVERVVFAAERGNVWFALLPAGSQNGPETRGVSYRSVFGR